MFLVCKALIAVTLDAELVIKALDVGIAVGNDTPLAVKLSIKLCILLSPFIIQAALFINVSTKTLDETDVSVDTALVVFIHASLLFVQPAKILFKVQKLVLQCTIVSLFGSEFTCLCHELCDQLFLCCSLLELCRLDLNLLWRNLLLLLGRAFLLVCAFASRLGSLFLHLCWKFLYNRQKFKLINLTPFSKK